jgi:hypothetical protein
MSDVHTAYCAACDRHVPARVVEAHSLGEVTRVLCLVSPEKCSGAFCLFEPAGVTVQDEVRIEAAAYAAV